MECIWAQVRKLRTDEWQERHIYRPYLAFDSILSEALQHNLPVILPPPHTASTQYPLPWVVFRMFDYTDCPEVDQTLILIFIHLNTLLTLANRFYISILGRSSSTWNPLSGAVFD